MLTDRRNLCLARAVAGLIAMVLSGKLQAAQNEWRMQASADIRAAYSIYKDSHPGWFDPANKGFRIQLARARSDALKEALHAENYADYAEALGTFSAVLDDGHARLVVKPNPSDGVSWPGFITAWRGNSLLVQSGTPPPGVHIGDRILACDGRPVREVIRYRLRSQGMRLNEAGHWWVRSPQAFTDRTSMGTRRPNACEFAGRAGVLTTDLNWTAAPEDIATRLRASGNGERTPIGITQPRHGVFLIGLSDFNPDDAGAAAYEKLFNELEGRHDELRQARAIILDLRWNDGGSTDWPRRTAELLWGKAAVDDRMDDYLRNVQIWWRASAANAKYLADAAASDSTDAGDGSATALAREVAKARAAGKRYFVQPASGLKQARGTAKPQLDTPVYVIVPGGCASACLDAIDIFKRFRKVKLIGAPSAADSLYLDARATDLPSGKALAVVPLKIWMNRPRRAGEIYRPDIEVDSLDWSTERFLEVIDSDLDRLVTK